MKYKDWIKLNIDKNQNNTNAVGVRNKQFWTFSDYFSLN